jgi:hypothetical protein
MRNYKLKKGETVNFKLKRSYRTEVLNIMPRCSGVVESSSKRLVWIKLKEVQGKPVEETVVCVAVHNIF